MKTLVKFIMSHEFLSFLEPNIAIFVATEFPGISQNQKNVLSPLRASHVVVRCHSFWGGSQGIRNIVFLLLFITSLLPSNCHGVHFAVALAEWCTVVVPSARAV